MFIERYPCCGKVYLKDDRKFPPLQAADMNAAWICRKTSPKIQRWTAADVYLERILQVPRPSSVTREWLEKLVAFSIEHEAQVKTFAESVEKDDHWLDKWRSKAREVHDISLPRIGRQAGLDRPSSVQTRLGHDGETPWICLTGRPVDTWHA